ncbi:MAG: hypothetical protein AB7I19_06085 [Planctomycetota bacterium]
MNTLFPSFVLGLTALAVAQDPHSTPTAKSIDAPQPRATLALAGKPGVVLPSATQRSGESLPAVPARPSSVWTDVIDGVGHGLGPDWKASFDGTALEFVPALGSEQPRNLPVRFELTNVAFGESDVPVPAGRLRAEGRTWRAERGPCTESIDLSERGVEQSWVFATLPSRRELRLTIEWSSDLSARKDASSIVFESAAGGVRYSEAVAFDARGHACPLDLELVEGRIELRVPEAFVATAELPLTVDPLASTLLIATGGNFTGFADVAFDYTTQEFLLVWQFLYSATDADIWAQRLDLNQQAIGVPFPIDFTSESWAYPRVANNGATDSFLVVAECSNALANPRWIGGRLWMASGGLGAPLVIEQAGTAGSFSGSCFKPDVGGDPSEVGTTWFTVVWERDYSPTDHDILMRQVSPFGTLASFLPTAIDLGGGYESRPRIAKSNGYSIVAGPGGQYWPVVYQRTFGPNDEDIRGSLVAPNGQLIGASNFPIASSSRDERSPTVSSPTEILGGRRRHAVAFERLEPTTSSDILVAVLDDAGTLLTTSNLQVLEGAGAAANWIQHYPTIDSDGVRFAVAYGEQWSGTGSDFDVRASTIAYDPTSNQLVAHESRVGVATTTDYESLPAIASTWSGGGSTLQHCIAFHRVSPTAYEVRAGIYEARSVGPLPTLRATGCHGLGITMTDLPALGRSITFDQSDSGPLTGFLLGFPIATPVPTCGGCVLGADGAILANPATLFVPPEVSLVGVSLACQAFSAVHGSCFGAVSLSDTIDFTIL